MNDDPVLSLAVLVENGGKGSIEATMLSGKIFEYAKKHSLFQ